ncbi:MAG: YceI family protein [candidate division Zixibacteria bacterium]|nr:YceI family protein [candidate division Zixibacteria bacterium]
MYKRLAMLIFVSLAMVVSAQAQTWNFDLAHSHVGFTVRHMVITKVDGMFNDFTGAITNFDGKDVAKGAVDVTIQIGSISTDNDMRDTHLKSPDFFDAAKFPTMTFKSKKIVMGTGGKFTMIGDLTMKGVTREVTLDCTLNGTVVDPQGNTRAGFSATTTINRQDYGVSWNNSLADGSMVVGNDVVINLEIEAVKAK